jgi:hypothetical protein
MAGQMGNRRSPSRIRFPQHPRRLERSYARWVPGQNEYVVVTKAATRTAYKRKGVGKEEVRSKNPLKASKKAAAGRG